MVLTLAKGLFCDEDVNSTVMVSLEMLCDMAMLRFILDMYSSKNDKT